MCLNINVHQLNIDHLEWTYRMNLTVTSKRKPIVETHEMMHMTWNDAYNPIEMPQSQRERARKE